jgi:AcrR family transcriptional regulator
MPKVVDHDARRAELLAATWRVIARDGIEGATVRRISREAGYSTGVLTHYFQNKEDVLRTALQASFSETRTRIEAQAAAGRGLSALRNAALAELPIDDERRHACEVRLGFWARASADESFAAEQRARYFQLRRTFATLLEQAIECGDLRSDLETEGEAECLIALCEGIGVQALFDTHRWTPERQTSAVDQHLGGLAQPKATRVGGRPKTEATGAKPGRPAQLS